VQGLTLNQAVEKMRGAVNSKIRLKDHAQGLDKPLDMAITRDTIRVRSVRSRTDGDTSAMSASPSSTSRPPTA